MSYRTRRMLNGKKRKNMSTEEVSKDVQPFFSEEEKIIEPIVILDDVLEKDIAEELREDERVICLNTEVIYDDYKHASKESGINAGAIKRCCDGATKSAGKDEEGNKLVWKYFKDVE